MACAPVSSLSDGAGSKNSKRVRQRLTREGRPHISDQALEYFDVGMKKCSSSGRLNGWVGEGVRPYLLIFRGSVSTSLDLGAGGHPMIGR